MKLNHINLTVTNVEANVDFLAKYFGLQIGDERSDAFASLYDDGGLLLAVLKGDQVSYPKTFHIGFIQESVDRVNEIYQLMKDDGLDVEPPRQAHGWTFYVQAPGGYAIEILSLER